MQHNLPVIYNINVVRPGTKRGCLQDDNPAVLLVNSVCSELLPKQKWWITGEKKSPLDNGH